MTSDILIVGGGVVGLSLAWRLRERSGGACRVTLLDRAQPARESSWAGAGILEPAGSATVASTAAATAPTAADQHERLMHWSYRLHLDWAQRLRALTEVDNGLRRCGGWWLAVSEAQAAQMAEAAEHRRAAGISVSAHSPREVAAAEPGLAAGRWAAAWLFPEATQVRNPWHGRALIAACERTGVTLVPEVPVAELICEGAAGSGRGSGRVTGVRAADGRAWSAAAVVVAAGSWSGELLAGLLPKLKTPPVRGQILLLRGAPTAAPLLARIVESGYQYMVPREDGRLLIGSTLEHVGFDKSTTATALLELRRYAAAVAPGTADLAVETQWAGLRPSNVDGYPYIGSVPSWPGLWVATGHYRHGLQTSTGTAELLADALLGQPPSADISLAPFRPDRALG